MPPFIYLVPLLALFGPTRFTGILAASSTPYPWRPRSWPTASAGVADDGGGRDLGRLEHLAADHQGPAADVGRTLVLATNQGLIYVLSMVVVSGLVGGGALGFDVVQGFTQLSVFGKGLAAGLAIVILGHDARPDHQRGRVATR